MDAYVRLVGELVKMNHPDVAMCRTRNFLRLTSQANEERVLTRMGAPGAGSLRRGVGDMDRHRRLLLRLRRGGIVSPLIRFTFALVLKKKALIITTDEAQWCTLNLNLKRRA